jgi:hypothetical protein
MGWPLTTAILAQTRSPDGSGSYPFILLVLLLAWIVFAAGTVKTIACFRPPVGTTGKWQVLLAAGILAVLALFGAVALSPPPPVLCTYTGLSHITSAFRIAALEWNWSFPTDYPLTVPLFAAPLVKGMGNVPEALGMANSILFALGVVGGFFLALEWCRSFNSAIVAGGILVCSPLLLLFAGSDSLSVGYFALSGWTLLYALRYLDADPDSGASKWWEAATLTAAFVLVCQTRLEALAFPAIAGVGALLIRGNRSNWRNLLYALLLPGAAALVFMLPYLARFYADIIATDRVSQELGTRHIWVLTAAAVILACGAFRYGRRGPANAAVWRLLPGLLLTLLFAGGCLAWYGPGFFTTGTVCAGDSCQGQTFSTVLFWHLNPKLTPWILLPAVFVGLTSADLLMRPGVWSATLIWIAVVVGAASTKATGELLFEGARTQLPASIPFAILAAAGFSALCKRWSSRWLFPVAALSATALFLPLSLPNATTLAYDEQQEFAFFRGCLPDLPARAVIYAPDDVMELVLAGDIDPVQIQLYPLFRTGYLAEALGDESSRLRIAPFSALETLHTDAPTSGTSFFFHNLNCYRTGNKTLSPSCRKIRQLHRLEPVCETTIDSLPYTSDYFDRIHSTVPSMKLGIYRLLPRTSEALDAIP